MDIEVVDITPEDAWPRAKQQDYEQLKVITRRILIAGIDVTNGFSEDLFNVSIVYGRYATEEAKNMLWSICRLSPGYDEKKLEECWAYCIKENKLKSNLKLTKICKHYDIDTTVKSDGAITSADEIGAYIHPKADPVFVLNHGFYGVVDGAKTGYYFRTGDKSFTAQTNFTIEPLMHVYSKIDNKRIISIHNGFKQAVLDMPSRSVISVDQFSALCYEEGNYMFWGGKLHLMKILNTINESFILCHELNFLGWQDEGFFAWSNAVYLPGTEVTRFNELGICSVKDTNYFSPSSSNIYQYQRKQEDEYQNDRYLTYQDSNISFSQWAALLHKVYPDHCILGIGSILLAMFRDIVFKIDNNCPHLSCYGQKGSGKSKFAESLFAIFFLNKLPLNLFHCTDFAFANHLERFINCMMWGDEFDDAGLKDDRFQAIKGAYDGSGREKGRGGSKNKTKIEKVNSFLLLTGQYLSTRDDNAALSRCIVLPFMPRNSETNPYSEEEIQNFSTLKEMEKKGITHLVIELIKHRADFKTAYIKNFPETFSEIRQLIIKENGIYQERVLRNYTAIANAYKYFLQHITFPFTYQQVLKTCIKDVIRLSTLISESDSLADFWNTVVYLLETGEIMEGFHFRILQMQSISIRKDGKDAEQKFPAPTKLLSIRLTTIHKLYMEAHRKQTGKNGINFQSLELYISSSKGYIGKNSSLVFTDQHGSKTNTSSFIFEYNLLGVNLERMAPEPEVIQSQIEGILDGDIQYIDVAGKPNLKYRIVNISFYKFMDKQIKKEESTICYDSVLSNEPVILSRQRLNITGSLKVSDWTDKEGVKRTKRSMDVAFVKYVNMQAELKAPDEELPF